MKLKAHILLIISIVVLAGICIPARAQIAIKHSVTTRVLPDSIDWSYYGKKHFWRAGAEVFGFNMGLWAYDRFIEKGDFAYISFKTIASNFRHGFKWDNDKLGTNTFLHPYTGNLYFNAGRANGFNFWQSELFAIGGSAMWEMFMEREYPSTNDIIATPIGGAALGEVLFRSSDAVLDDRTWGAERFERELACFILSPMRGFNRIITGDAWRRRATRGHIFGTPSFALRVSSGIKSMVFQGRFHNILLGYGVQIDAEYGDCFELKSTKPYDYFTIKAELQAMKSQPVLNRISITGRLLARELLEERKSFASVGLYQHFDFYDSDTIDGINKVPFKLGIPASVGVGAMFRDVDTKRWVFDATLHANAIILGSVLSDHYKTDERNYNWASGFSIKSHVNWVFDKTRLAFSLSNEYYRLFSWVGYRYGTDLSTVDYRILNVQGDHSAASFNVTTARFDFKLHKHVFGALEFTNYFRSTHYRDYKHVVSSTMAARMMIAYKF